jgi:hypothetical protein
MPLLVTVFFTAAALIPARLRNFAGLSRSARRTSSTRGRCRGAGRCNMRHVLWGAIAMAVTAGIGWLFGTVI